MHIGSLICIIFNILALIYRLFNAIVLQLRFCPFWVIYTRRLHIWCHFFGKNVIFVASKLSARGRFIFCLWSMFTTFSHNFKNITQNGQNQSCDTIALKRRYIYISVYDSTAILLKEIKPHIPIYNQQLNMKTYSYSFMRNWYKNFNT